ncbi:MAG: hypothetical protein EOO64_03155 [Massilia sp.]|nr:MAG: hypothetical protein EOO64_03155 [Massilia sp.]
MKNRITAAVIDENTILLDGRRLNGIEEVGAALASALQSDPDFTLVIESKPGDHYKAIGTIIYASQRVGVPVENLRWTTDDGDVVSFDELKARNSSPPAR